MEALNLEFIKAKRTKMGLTFQEMADFMGMKNASTYYKYEVGQYAFKADQLPLLADSLKCKITDFFTRNVAESATKEVS